MIKANVTYLLILMTWYILFVIFMIVLYFKYSKPYHVKKIDKYYKDIPEQLNPIELSMLIYHKITPNALSATITYLLDQGLIIRDGDILRKVEAEQLLSISQNSAIELLFDVLGDGKKVDINKIGDFCHNNSTSTDFLLVYDIWSNLAVREASSSKQFFVQKTDYELVRWFQIIGYVLAGLNFVFNFHYIVGYIVLIPAYFILQYFYKTYKRTREYNEQFYKWLGFGNYLSTLSSKDDLKLNYSTVIIYSILLNKISHVEQLLNNEQFLTKLDSSLQKCYRRAFFFGNRKI